MTAIIAKSVDAKLELVSRGSGNKPIMVAAACSEYFALNKLTQPYVEMDIRGYGKSKVDNSSIEETTLSHYMEDFGVSFKALGQKKIALMGYSHTGYFTTQFALKNPGAVSALIGVEPALFNDREDLLHRANLAKEGRGLESVSAMLETVGNYSDTNLKSIRHLSSSIMEHVQNNDTLAMEFVIRANNPVSKRDLQSLKTPTLLIAGTESRAAHHVEKAACLIPHASVWWVTGANHLDLMSEKYAQQISSVIDTFLAEHK